MVSSQMLDLLLTLIMTTTMIDLEAFMKTLTRFPILSNNATGLWPQLCQRTWDGFGPSNDHPVTNYCVKPQST
ncbi:hypothetical protein EG68_07585 [Paragonimus skrjabini miyazakii]|uniref:Secreted protein n=1 Tax=Paragonimus skrjabini miyazakii TaxID=59628 RepID=A0A8S9YMQ4_9TREM|nr:hypothetical protein EG68_07585 [Paragonimus skrjabini miyazakii]